MPPKPSKPDALVATPVPTTNYRNLQILTLALIPLVAWGVYIELAAQQHCRVTKEEQEWLHTAETNVGKYIQCFLRPRLAAVRARTRQYFPEEHMYPRWTPMARFTNAVWQFLCFSGGLIYLFTGGRRQNNKAVIAYTASQVFIFIGAWYPQYRHFFYLFQLGATFAVLHCRGSQWDGNTVFHFGVGTAVLAFLLLSIFLSWQRVRDSPESAGFTLPDTALDLLSSAFTLPVIFFTQGTLFPTTLVTSILVGARALLFHHSPLSRFLGLLQFPTIFRDVDFISRSWMSIGIIRKLAVPLSVIVVAFLWVSSSSLQKPPFLNGDKYLGLWYRVIVGDGEPWPQPPPSVVPLPVGHGNLPKEMMEFGEWLPYTDPQDAPQFKTRLQEFFIKDALIDLTKHPGLFPLEDDITPWASHDEALKALNETTGNRGKIPVPNIDWEKHNLISDEGISHIALAGVAARWLVVVNSTDFATLDPVVKQEAFQCGALFVSDFTDVAGFEVRPLYSPFGSALFIDAGGNPVSIMLGDSHVVRRKDPKWEEAKFHWRSTAVIAVTVIDHLVGVHLMAANLLTTASRELLPETHPIRIFLTPFTYRSLIINHGAAQFLTTEFGIIHRATSFTGVGLMKALHYSFMEVDRFFDLRSDMVNAGLLNESTLSDVERVQHEGTNAAVHLTPEQLSWCSVATDLADFFQIVHNYVTNYINLYYDTDAKMRHDRHLHDFLAGLPAHKDHPTVPVHVHTTAELAILLANFVSHVTAIHSLVGNVAEYLIDPRYAGSKLVPNRAETDQQASIQGLLVAVLTGQTQPKLVGDWGHIFKGTDPQTEKARVLMEEFQRNLTGFGKLVDKRNKHRRFPTNAIHPRHMDSSVAV